ncbi:3938_t:CDS:2, partial [Racocetra fulgida]
MSKSSSSQVSTQSSETKKCFYCKKIKSKADFCRLRSDDLLYEHGTCNMCFEERSKRRHEKKAKTDTYLNLTVPTIGTSISNVTNTYQVDDSLEVYDDREPTSEANPEFANVIQIEEIEENITTIQDDEYNGDNNTLSYCLDELGQDLDLEDGSLDLKKVKKSFAQITKILILPLKSGSRYYWNIYKLCLNLKRKAFTGRATAYLYCALRDDRIWQRQDNQENSTLENPITEGSRSGNSRSTSVIAGENKMNERQEKYAQYVKKFEKALELYQREMDNDNFIKNFDTLVGLFVKAIGECEEA